MRQYIRNWTEYLQAHETLASFLYRPLTSEEMGCVAALIRRLENYEKRNCQSTRFRRTLTKQMRRYFRVSDIDIDIQIERAKADAAFVEWNRRHGNPIRDTHIRARALVWAIVQRLSRFFPCGSRSWLFKWAVDTVEAHPGIIAAGNNQTSTMFHTTG